MKTNQTYFFTPFLLAIALLSGILTGCNGACDQVDCINGECVEEGGIASCLCEAGFEGDRCDRWMNEKFGGTFAAQDLCGGNQQVNYTTIVTPAPKNNEFVFENFSDQDQDIEALIGQDGYGFIIPEQPFLGGTVSGSGEMSPDLQEITLNYQIEVVGWNTQSCQGVMSRQP